jgi:predicted GNAT superfamily acetyltransferase
MKNLQELGHVAKDKAHEIGDAVKAKAVKATDAAGDAAHTFKEGVRRGGMSWYAFGALDAILVGLVIGYFIGRRRSERPALERVQKG